MVRRDRFGAGAAGIVSVVQPPGARNASARASASVCRCPGRLASAFSMASAAGAGTSGRSERIGWSGEDTWRATTACGDEPRNGGAPVSISYATQPRGVDVGAAVDLLAGRLLGAHVDRRADDEAGARHAVVRRRGDGARHPEVGHDGVAGEDEHVGGLDVAVDHAVPVGVGQRVGDLAGDRQRLVDREPRLAPEPVAERLALDERHDVVEDAVGLARVVDREDVRVGEAGRDLDLADEPLGAERGGDVAPEDLDRDAPVLPEVLRQVDRRHSASADLALERIALPENGSGTYDQDHELQRCGRWGNIRTGGGDRLGNDTSRAALP